MKLNFTKEEGSKSNYILDIFSSGATNSLIGQLKQKNKYTDEFKNDSAYVERNNKKYPNITYSFDSRSLIQLEEGIEIIIRDFVSNVPEGAVVSLRMNPDITQDRNNHYHFVFRAAIVTP